MSGMELLLRAVEERRFNNGPSTSTNASLTRSFESSGSLPPKKRMRLSQSAGSNINSSFNNSLDSNANASFRLVSQSSLSTLGLGHRTNSAPRVNNSLWTNQAAPARITPAMTKVNSVWTNQTVPVMKKVDEDDLLRRLLRRDFDASSTSRMSRVAPSTIKLGLPRALSRKVSDASLHKTQPSIGPLHKSSSGPLKATKRIREPSGGASMQLECKDLDGNDVGMGYFSMLSRPTIPSSAPSSPVTPKALPKEEQTTEDVPTASSASNRTPCDEASVTSSSASSASSIDAAAKSILHDAYLQALNYGKPAAAGTRL